MSSNSSCGSSYSSGCRRFEMNYEGNPRICFCEIKGRKLKAPRQTSWTDDNPGRRFYGCRFWKTKNCGYFDWHDESMSKRAKDVINELKHENSKLLKMNGSCSGDGDVEAEIAQLWDALQRMKEDSEKMKKKTRIAYSILIATWLFLIFFFVL